MFQNPFKLLKSKNHNITIDLMKTVAIFFVILTHSIARMIPNGSQSLIYNLIFVAQMPLFMYCAGRLFEKRKNISSLSDFFNLLIKNACKLLIPFVSYSIIVSLIDSNFTVSFFKYFGNCFLVPDNSLWFLWVLFWMEAICAFCFYISNKIFKKGREQLNFYISILLYLALAVIPGLIYFYFGYHIFNFNSFVFYSPYFLIGLMVSNLLESKKILCKNLFKLFLTAISVAGLCVIMIFHPTISQEDHNLTYYLCRSAAGFCCIAIFNVLFSYLSNFNFAKKISTISVFSLEFYYVHILLNRIPLFSTQVSPNFLGAFQFIGLFLLLIVISFLVILLVKSVKFLDWILFGVRIKKRNLFEFGCDEDLQVDEKFKVVITSKHKVFDLHIKETFKYRDLIFLFVKRNFTSQYKQTLLGPLWAIIQPLLTTFVFTFIFGSLASLTTADIPGPSNIPSFLFYLSGTMLFHYFSSTVNATSKTFIGNAAIMGKVYYPRLVQPIATAISHLISLAIQFGLFVIVWIAYICIGGYSIEITPWLLFLPLIVLEMMILATGLGMLISALTTKFRDLQMLVGFGLQLWQYATPIPYGLMLIQNSSYSDLFPYYMSLNPMTSIVTTFRYAMFGQGYFNIGFYLAGWGISALVFFLGLLAFSKTERTFMDTI